jgi:hypothetical protein
MAFRLSTDREGIPRDVGVDKTSVATAVGEPVVAATGVVGAGPVGVAIGVEHAPAEKTSKDRARQNIRLVNLFGIHTPPC